ncbi:teichoic acids export ABC transporter ATP-binding subunit TagH [Niallia sp. NCCP-28]|uniref:teichoic acids export ABC transporter ATP-binding subunit TagH n=1 Tax=Niallia sp. NCCP-28 TaxID=2934712 RepID=UPI00208482FD|nr:teichoic acids export ABC transporter ATP-binding subunit TagH [Niallia sp. NCCP-28]GKU83418.1 teichoic acids export ABC transporter ATP-binding subunit TagH [Niallia sp. NCCP-28]
MKKSVVVKNLTKRYKLYANNGEKLKDIFLPKSYGEAFFALRNVSFEAEQGDVIGFVGVNGSGKSTLSNIVAGIVPPTSGEVEIDGQASLIAVAAGVNGELTGRENIELKCLMMGFSKEEIAALEPDIIEFSELGKFIDQPVKSYSSGMKSRLGFAISVNTNPDVLIIDEALSVGDKAFADKCLKKMEEFKERGKTMFFVSHSIGQMKQFCQKAIWLEHGELKMTGSIQEVIPAYEEFLKEYNKLTAKQKKEFREEGFKKRSDPNFAGKV